MKMNKKFRKIMAFILAFAMIALPVAGNNGNAAYAAAGDSGIKVQFSLYGDDEHGESGHTAYKTWIAPEEVAVPAGSTVEYLFEFMLKKYGISYDAAAGYVQEVNGLREMENGSMSGWLYMVSEKSPSVGYSEYVLADGDAVRFYYTDDFMNDDGNRSGALPTEKPKPSEAPTQAPAQAPAPAPAATRAPASVVTKAGVKYAVSDVEKKEATACGASKKTLKSLKVADTVEINGVTLKVTSIKAGAFAGMKNLKKATIGKNVKTIGKKAFFNDKELKSIIVKGKNLKKVKAKAFANISAKAAGKAPKSCLKRYKGLLGIKLS